LNESTFQASISADELNALPLGKYEGPLKLIASDEEAREAVHALKHERILGFDTETRAVFRKGESHPPALVQLAAEHAVYIFRLQHMTEIGGLAVIFSNPKIVKAGVALGFDLLKLNEVHAFKPAGFVELQKATDHAGIRSNGLRALAGIVLGIRISKSAQRTNWSRPDLSAAQLNYAATDAWVCREVYLRLEARGLLPPGPEPSQEAVGIQ